MPIFVDLWDTWPKRPRRGSKKDAERRWETLSAQDQADCLQGAHAAAESAQWARGYEPGVARWINGRLWEAYLEADTQDEVTEADWDRFNRWVRRVGRHNAEVCAHNPECIDGETHMRRILQVLRVSE